MAERRMFNKTLLLSNSFTRLSRAAAQLYFFLCLTADDDGFADNTESISRMCRCTGRNLQELVDSGWVIHFDSGVIAIAHWFLHNQIKKDRYKPTIFQKERAMLEKTGTGMYVRMDPNRIQTGSGPEPQYSIVQTSLAKDSIDQDSQEEESPFAPAGPACDDMDYEKVLDTYQRLCPKLVPCHGLTPGLREKIAACYREGYTWMRLPWIFIKANASLFLQGDNGRRWQADLEWLLDPAHLQAVEEGKYDTWDRGFDE